MTATLDGVTNKRKDKPEPTAEQKLAEELVARAREQGVSLTGPGGLLGQITKAVLERALGAELDDHLGYVKGCLLYTSPSPRDPKTSRMPSSA